MIINHNMMAMNTHRQMGINQNNSGKSIEKLSSGLRINRAGDDAAGLAISEKMRGQIRGLNQASRNAETHDILQRMRELAVQSSNDTLQPEDRTAIGTELGQLVDEIDRIASDTKFNGKTLLGGSLGVSRSGGTLDTSKTGLANLSDISVANAAASGTYTIAEVAGTTMKLTDGNGNSQTIDISGLSAGDTVNFDALGVKIKTDANFDTGANNFNGLTITTGAATGATFQIGSDAGQDLAINVSDMSASGLSVDALDVTDHTKANLAITSIENAITAVSTQRANLGANQNRLEHTIKNLDTSSENLQASESRIRDVDMAKEMMEFQKNNILQQAAQSMLAQANQAPEGVLQLLR